MLGAGTAHTDTVDVDVYVFSSIDYIDIVSAMRYSYWRTRNAESLGYGWRKTFRQGTTTVLYYCCCLLHQPVINRGLCYAALYSTSTGSLYSYPKIITFVFVLFFPLWQYFRWVVPVVCYDITGTRSQPHVACTPRLPSRAPRTQALGLPETIWKYRRLPYFCHHRIMSADACCVWRQSYIGLVVSRPQEVEV